MIFSVSVPTGDFSFIYNQINEVRVRMNMSFRPHRGLFFYLSMKDFYKFPSDKFPSPPGTFLLSILDSVDVGSTPTWFPSPPGTFLLSIRSEAITEAKKLMMFPSPPGTFLLSMRWFDVVEQIICVSVPTGDFSFIYPVLGTP